MSKDKESIQVTIRVRPLSEKQITSSSQSCLWVEEETNSIYLTAEKDKEKKYTFDSVCDRISQDNMFEKVGRKSTQYCMQGYNCTIFAYGQTGAGKTFTMMGSNPEHQNYYQLRGLIPRTLQHLFGCIENQIRQSEADYNIKCSFIEIYNEQVMDLLNKNSSNLSIREDLKKGVYVQGVSEQNINSSEQAMQILRKGSKGRHVGSTHYNQYSSRSHSVFTMQIQSTYLKNGIKTMKSRHFHFIDLAGSQRTEKSYGQRLKQGCSINKSLHVLSNVIKSLGQASLKNKKQHVNYRDSKLTFLLKDSLDGNSKTHLIANISPSFASSLQTSSTLRFARQVKLIKVNKASINEDSVGSLQDLKTQIRRLRSQLISYKNSEIGNMNGQVSNEQNNASNGKMVKILHKYVEQELQKQTKVQEQVSKLVNENENLQKGIKQYNENQIHLRMIISIYEDKIKRLQQAQQFYKSKIEQAQTSQLQEEVKDYFMKEREQLLKENAQLKHLSSSSKLIKSLLSQLKATQGDNVDKQTTLSDILFKNTAFLQQIKESIAQIQVEPKNEDSNEYTYEQLQKKNQQYQQELEKVTMEVLQTKQTLQENQNILKQSINIQISLQQRLKTATSAKEKVQEQYNQLQKENEQLSASMQEMNSVWEIKNNQLMIQVSQGQVQISQLKNDVSVMREEFNFQENSLKEKLQNLQTQKLQLQQTIKQKTQQVHNNKNEIINIHNDYEKLQYEMESQLKNKEYKINQLEQSIKNLNTEKAQNKNKLQLIKSTNAEEMENKNKEMQQVNAKYMNIREQHKTIQHELQKEKQVHTLLKDKYQALTKQYEEEKSRYQVKHDELMKMVQENKISDSQTFNKLSQTQIQLIKLQDTKQQEQMAYKREIQSIKEKLQLTQIQKEDIKQDKDETYKQIKLVEEDNKQYKERINSLNEENNIHKRNTKEKEEEITDLKEKLKNSIENGQKIKEKEKELKVLYNEQKNEIYALKKNSQVQIQSNKELYKQKCEEYASLQREYNRSKDNYEKTIKETHKQIAIKEQLFVSNEQSIKKTMGSLLVNKQNKISQLTSTNEAISNKNKQLTQNYDKLCGVKDKLQEQLQENRHSSEQMMGALRQKQGIIEQMQERIQKADDKHMRQMESIQSKCNEQIDQKNAQIQQYLLKTQSLQSQYQTIIAQMRKQKEQLYESINLKVQQEKGTNVRLQEQVRNHQQQVSNLKEQLNNYKVQALNYQQQMCSYQEQLKNSSQQRDTYQQQISVHKQQLNNYQQEIHNYKVKAQEVNEEMQNLLKQKEYLIQQREQQVQGNHNHQQQLLRQRAEKEEVLREKEEMIRDKQAQIQQLQTQLETILRDHSNTHKMLTKKYDEQMKDMQEHNLIVTQIKQRNERLLQEMKQMDAQVKYKNQQLQQYKCKLQESHRQISSKCQQQEKYRSRQQQQQSQIHNYERTCAQLQQTIKQNKRVLQRVHQEQQMTRKQYEIIKEQQQEAIRHKQQVMNVMQFEISQEREKVQELKKYIQYQNVQKEHHSKEKQQLLNYVQSSKTELQEIKNNLLNKENNMLEEIERLSSQLKSKQKQQQSWKKCIEEWENSLNEAQIKIKGLKRQNSKEKQTNKNFRGLIQNAQCQINQLKLQLAEKENSYKKLLEKVSRNQFNKGSNIQNQRLSEMLEKSRAQYHQTKKMFEDQRKINKGLKIEIKEKEESIENIKVNAQEYCKKQHQQMASIQSDYLKIQQKHHFAQKQLTQLKEELSSYKIGTTRAAMKIEQMEESSRKVNRDIIDLQRENDELKKDSLRTGMDQRQKMFINKIKDENNNLKRQLDRVKQNLVKEAQEKAKLKSEKRYGKEGFSTDTSRELEKKNTEIKHLQEIITQACNIVQVKNQPKNKYDINRSNLVLGIRNLIKEKHTAKEKAEELQQQVLRINEKVSLYQNQKPRNNSKFRHTQGQQRDHNLSKQIRTKLTQQSQYSNNDKSAILRSMDQNKNQYYKY